MCGQGLVAFTTLLESHTDTAFDFFEVWSKRNIFYFSPDLPIVTPHQKGLDLTTRPEEEAELLTEIEELRRRIENVSLNFSVSHSMMLTPTSLSATSTKASVRKGRKDIARRSPQFGEAVAASRLPHARVPCIQTSCIFTILSKHFYKSQAIVMAVPYIDIRRS